MEVSQFHRRDFNVDQVSIALPSSNQLDDGIKIVGLSCCGSCPMQKLWVLYYFLESICSLVTKPFSKVQRH